MSCLFLVVRAENVVHYEVAEVGPYQPGPVTRKRRADPDVHSEFQDPPPNGVLAQDLMQCLALVEGQTADFTEALRTFRRVMENEVSTYRFDCLPNVAGGLRSDLLDLHKMIYESCDQLGLIWAHFVQARVKSKVSCNRNCK